MTDPLAEFLHAMAQTHASGQATDETSYYDALTGFLNAIGADLKPSVRAVLTLKDRGAGLPDGGLFSANQLRTRVDNSAESGALPSRGAIEVKPLGDDVQRIAQTEQVGRYLQKYGQVLVTNYREFLLVGRNQAGQPRLLETYSLAPSESAFWKLARNNQQAAIEQGPAIAGYLRRVMVRPAPITAPEDLAWVLASYAQEALRRVESAPMDALEAFKESLQGALGIKFDSKKSLHFFHSTLVQTLFYGIFSGWVIWSKGREEEATFDWREAAWTLHLPAVRGLFSEVATPRRIKTLNLMEVLDWTAEALARVDRKEFFARFEDKLAIQYFYEPFLESFDPVLRKELGVWYTPPEIVHYMVERIDKTLREELGIEDGFADPNVFVLDPCAGTGSFLVEVLRRIERTLKESGEDEFLSTNLKRAATDRIFGFEILPAPFVVAHLQVGLFLQSAGSPLNLRTDERAGIYLTNSLVGWEPPEGPQKRLAFVELQEEREASDRVKRDTPILVVLGNPPYNAFAGASPDEEHGLVDAYSRTLRDVWRVKKFNLGELYARFVRVAERQIAERTKRGVFCYISSFSYLSDPSFVVMRERLWSQFDQAWIDDLNGDTRGTGKRSPDGSPDPSIFSTPRNREGIKLGTAIGLFVKKGLTQKSKDWHYRILWGTRKREELVESLEATDLAEQYRLAKPQPENQFNFRPVSVSADYYSWPSLTDLCNSEPSQGLMEKRGSALIAIDRDRLKERMRRYLDRAVSWDELQAMRTGLTEDAAGFDARDSRSRALRIELFDEGRIVPYAIRPFDYQWAYYSDVPTLWNRNRPQLRAQMWAGNSFFVSRRFAVRSPEGPPFYFTRRLIDDHFLAPDAVAFPIHLRTGHQKLGGPVEPIGAGGQVSPNYSARLLAYLEAIGLNGESESTSSSMIWQHALAIGFSPKYLEENHDGVMQDWPRIPLPTVASLLNLSAGLGEKVAGLLDSDEVSGITRNPIRPEIEQIARLHRDSGKGFDPEHELVIDRGWGRQQQGGVFPGVGKAILREYSPAELTSFRDGARALQSDVKTMTRLLGSRTYDVYLNEDTFWSNIPKNVWDYHIGGYQVIKKWLSYRETSILGRPISPDEARQVRGIARRIAGLLLLQPDLDKNYVRIAAGHMRWQEADTPPTSRKAANQRRRNRSQRRPRLKQGRQKFGGQVSFGKGGKMKGTASLKNWKEE
jgi:Type ISP C-terminal specificity domain/N-6 DNA Methylase